jgi:DNA modification methylase
MGEIDLLIDHLSPAPVGEDDPADAPAPPGGPAVTKTGDLWLLGSHRLLCANALEPSAYAALMGERKAAMVFTDAPYNVAIAGHVSGKGAIAHREFAMACGEMSALEFTGFLSQVCQLLAQHSVDGAIHYHCMDWRHLAEILAAGHSVYNELKNVCIWVKDNAGLGSLYRSQHELILVWKHGTAAHHNNVQLGQFGRHRSNVWRYPGGELLRAQQRGG